MDTLAMLSEIRSNLSMFKTSFDLAYINIFLSSLIFLNFFMDYR